MAEYISVTGDELKLGRHVRLRVLAHLKLAAPHHWQAPAHHRSFDCLPSHPVPAAHTAPPAMSVMPAMKRIVSARVSNQLLRMLRLNRWTASGMVVSSR